MIQWSGDLGSDITFFLSQGTAYCTGRGEIMTPTDPLLAAGTRVCLVKPSVGLSTPSVFKALDYEEISKLDPYEVLLPAFLHSMESKTFLVRILSMISSHLLFDVFRNWEISRRSFKK